MSSDVRTLQLIQSSPAVAGLCPSKRARLLPVIMSDLSSHLLQDALAVMLFPQEQDAAAIDNHLTAWAERALRNPFEQGDQAGVDRLLAFWVNVVQLVEDYFGKATSSYSPRAYHSLPFSTVDTSTEMFDLCNLSPAERSRTMWAFLRYELITKVCHADFYDPSWKDRGWAPLREYQGRHYSAFELELLNCIQEYFRCLHGAIFAHLAGAWVPCRPTTVVPRGRGSGLLYPDNLTFNPGSYAQDLGLKRTTCSGMATYFASYGIDLAVNFARAAVSGSLSPSELRKVSKLTSMEKTKNYSGSGWRYGIMTNLSWPVWPRFPLASQSWIDVPGMASLLHPRLYGNHFDKSLRMKGSCRRFECDFRQHRMYRQRAWVFFDDWRLYPPSWTNHFPTARAIQTLEILSLGASGTYTSISQARILHRSGAWNLDGASERDVLWADPAAADNEESLDDLERLKPLDLLQPWLKPCWKLP